jgi:hypothetical protein
MKRGQSNATTASGRQEMTADDTLLQVIEAWASLTPARRQMILAILRGNDSGQWTSPLHGSPDNHAITSART